MLPFRERVGSPGARIHDEGAPESTRIPSAGARAARLGRASRAGLADDSLTAILSARLRRCCPRRPRRPRWSHRPPPPRTGRSRVPSRWPRAPSCGACPARACRRPPVAGGRHRRPASAWVRGRSAARTCAPSGSPGSGCPPCRAPGSGLRSLRHTAGSARSTEGPDRAAASAAAAHGDGRRAQIRVRRAIPGGEGEGVHADEAAIREVPGRGGRERDRAVPRLRDDAEREAIAVAVGRHQGCCCPPWTSPGSGRNGQGWCRRGERAIPCRMHPRACCHAGSPGGRVPQFERGGTSRRLSSADLGVVEGHTAAVRPRLCGISGAVAARIAAQSRAPVTRSAVRAAAWSRRRAIHPS